MRTGIVLHWEWTGCQPWARSLSWRCRADLSSSAPPTPHTGSAEHCQGPGWACTFTHRAAGGFRALVSWVSLNSWGCLYVRWLESRASLRRGEIRKSFNLFSSCLVLSMIWSVPDCIWKSHFIIPESELGLFVKLSFNKLLFFKWFSNSNFQVSSPHSIFGVLYFLSGGEVLHTLYSLCSWSAAVAALSFCAAPSAMTSPRSRARWRCLSHALWFLSVQNLFIWSPYFSHSTFCKGFLWCWRGWVSPFGPKSTFSEDLTLLSKKNLPLQSYQGEESGIVPFNPVCGYLSKHVTIVLGALRIFRRNGWAQSFSFTAWRFVNSVHLLTLISREVKTVVKKVIPVAKIYFIFCI